MRFIVCLKPWCATDELSELRGVEYELMKEAYGQMFKQRGIDRSEEVL